MATCCESSSSSCCSSSNDATSYLILGDGDFSFSYDLARRILLESSSASTATALPVSSSFHSSTTSPSPPVPPPPLVHIHMTATGIDTRSEVESKYKDSSFLLKKLKGLSSDTTTTTATTNLTISVQHGVNAILPPPTLALPQPESSQLLPFIKDEEDTTTTSSFSHCSSSSNGRHCHCPPPADIVIFNHPHLGVEDAHLHARFLAHLLDSVNGYWLKKKRVAANGSDSSSSGGSIGIFYLTLALGQWERWKGDEAAARLGWFMVNRLPFQAPLTAVTVVDTTADDDHVVKPYFQLRRHQTGKSFANRRKANASETFALGRLADKDSLLQNSSSSGRLFWYSPTPTVNPETTPTTTRSAAAPFACPFCDRTFTEQRSVKNHIRCKHANHEPDSNRNCSVTHVNGVEQKHDPEHSQKQQQQQHQPEKEWECPYCSNNTSDTRSHDGHVSKRPRRVFNNQQALNDHIKAKHQALHSHIPPDYKTMRTEAVVAAIAEGSEQQQEQSVLTAAAAVPQPPFGHCEICLEVFENAQGARHHMDRFIPPPTTAAATTTMTAPVSSELEMTLKQFACSFCAKAFREKRAMLQHENFCSVRPEASVDEGQS